MDLTAAAEFTLSMAQTALEKDLLQETPWLRDFDAVYDQIKADHDGRDADLCTLITLALQNGGLISQNKRKSYADRVPGRVFDAIDALCTARLAAKGQVQPRRRIQTRQRSASRPGTRSGST